MNSDTAAGFRDRALKMRRKKITIIPVTEIYSMKFKAVTNDFSRKVTSFYVPSTVHSHCAVISLAVHGDDLILCFRKSLGDQPFGRVLQAKKKRCFPRVRDWQ